MRVGGQRQLTKMFHKKKKGPDTRGNLSWRGPPNYIKNPVVLTPKKKKRFFALFTLIPHYNSSQDISLYVC